MDPKEPAVRGFQGVSSMPLRWARNSSASTNSSLWKRITKSKAVPPAPQGKHLKICLAGDTRIDGFPSSWNGHSPTCSRPCGRNATLSPISATMSVAESTRSRSLFPEKAMAFPEEVLGPEASRSLTERACSERKTCGQRSA